ncbi:MAG: hypothetical protein IPN46_14620 [Saprospiraceae bacterium]|nr:hypothetical protein [Saprospiraceae bacterium]
MFDLICAFRYEWKEHGIIDIKWGLCHSSYNGYTYHQQSKERLITILVSPLISCSAGLPV